MLPLGVRRADAQESMSCAVLPGAEIGERHIPWEVDALRLANDNPGLDVTPLKGRALWRRLRAGEYRPLTAKPVESNPGHHPSHRVRFQPGVDSLTVVSHASLVERVRLRMDWVAKGFVLTRPSSVRA